MWHDNVFRSSQTIRATACGHHRRGFTISISKTSIHPAQVIAITSGKGGVGKTTIAVNLGIALATRGYKVCLFDADTGLANVNILLGLHPQFTLQHLLNGEKSIRQILYRGPRGLYIVPAASGIADLAQLNSEKRQRLLANLRAMEQFFDYLILDTAAGIDYTVQQFVYAAGCPIVVITPEPTSLTDAFSLLRVLKARRNIQPGVVVNRVNNGEGEEIFCRFSKAVKDFLDIDITAFGWIAQDSHIQNSILRQQPYILTRPYSHTGKATYALATKIVSYFQDSPTYCSLSRHLDQPLIPNKNRVALRPVAVVTTEEPTVVEHKNHLAADLIGRIENLNCSATDYRKIAQALEHGYQKQFQESLFNIDRISL